METRQCTEYNLKVHSFKIVDDNGGDKEEAEKGGDGGGKEKKKKRGKEEGMALEVIMLPESGPQIADVQGVVLDFIDAL